MLITADRFGAYSIGAKAERLFRMKRNGLPVPELFCVTPDVQAQEVNAYVRKHFSEGVLFAVRSSATAEDSAACSFAGQLDTFLFEEGLIGLNEAFKYDDDFTSIVFEGK